MAQTFKKVEKSPDSALAMKNKGSLEIMTAYKKENPTKSAFDSPSTYQKLVTAAVEHERKLRNEG